MHSALNAQHSALGQASRGANPRQFGITATHLFTRSLGTTSSLSPCGINTSVALLLPEVLLLPAAAVLLVLPLPQLGCCSVSWSRDADTATALQMHTATLAGCTGSSGCNKLHVRMNTQSSEGGDWVHV